MSVSDGLASEAFTLEIRIDEPPELAVPTGPGQVGGTTHHYASVDTGDPLDFSIEATHTDPNEPLTLTVGVNQGTLTPSEAGFTSTFPATTTSTTPVMLSFQGQADIDTGSVEFRLLVEDSLGNADTKHFTIAVNGLAAAILENRPATMDGIGMEYRFTPSVLGYPTPTVGVSGLPGWLTWVGTTISGTPSAADGPATGPITISTCSSSRRWNVDIITRAVRHFFRTFDHQNCKRTCASHE